MNAARPLASNAAMNLIVQFTPQSQMHSRETITVASSYGRVQIVLVGQGVSPSLRIEPADGIIDVGHILAGDVAEAKCTFHNCSVFPLNFA